MISLINITVIGFVLNDLPYEGISKSGMPYITFQISAKNNVDDEYTKFFVIFYKEDIGTYTYVKNAHLKRGDSVIVQGILYQTPRYGKVKNFRTGELEDGWELVNRIHVKYFNAIQTQENIQKLVRSRELNDTPATMNRLSTNNVKYNENDNPFGK